MQLLRTRHLNETLKESREQTMQTPAVRGHTIAKFLGRGVWYGGGLARGPVWQEKSDEEVLQSSERYS